jgi:N-acetylneuraminate synthase
MPQKQKATKNKKFDFNDLFIFEIANNHQGVFDHGLRIIREMIGIARRTGVRGAIKLQFRDLETLVHPAHRKDSGDRFIRRFQSTKLRDEHYTEYIREIQQAGLLTMCTPFDEPSVQHIQKLGVEVLKVASSSSNDWPLLEEIAKAQKPVVCSTGALTFEKIDKAVDFFKKRNVNFALLHCVSIYPTPNHLLSLNQIELMRVRYPDITIGFSTHESPKDSNVIRTAYGKGARLFEKHVGIEAAAIPLNAYSATPEQVEAWINAWKEAKEACGPEGPRTIPPEEIRDARAFMRGVYVARDIKKGDSLTRKDVFFAIPVLEGQLTSGQWSESMQAQKNYKKDEAVMV